MDVPVAAAIDALTLLVSGLLPSPPSPELAPEVLVNPLRSYPSGIGGYLGLHPAPQGEIHARRIQAQIVIRVKADSLSGLGPTEAAVTQALLGADQTQLRSQGLFRIVRQNAPGIVYQGADDGLTVAAGKDLLFDADFEFRRVPSAPAGVIEELPLDALLQTTDRKAEVLFTGDFATDPLDAFASFDDAPVVEGPGAWGYNAALGQVEQTAAIGGGANAFNPNKRGTYLVLEAAPPPPDWLLQVDLGADSGGVGLVFNFRDIENFYFFIMNRPQAYRLFGKKVAGTLSFLDVGGRQNGIGYSAGEHRLRLVQQRGILQLAIDEAPALEARESVPPPAGSMGFLCRNCVTARFRSLRWLGL